MKMRFFEKALLVAASAGALAACQSLSLPASVGASEEAGDDIVAAEASLRAPSQHDSLLVMDSHLDTPAFFAREDYSLAGTQTFAESGVQVDLPRMIEGGLDGGFWVIFTRQGELTTDAFQAARDAALIRAAEIREAAAKHHESFELAFQADDAARISADGKRIIYQSIENAYPLGLDVSLLETFYRLGVRMVGPVHFANNQFADSSTDPAGQSWDGLSPLGEDLVREANRLGMILDGSHAHDRAVEDMIDLSETPIILSHTGVKAIYDHPRNIDDVLLRKLADSGGVMQVNAYGGYLEELVNSPERQAAIDALNASIGGDPSVLDETALAAYRDAFVRINADFPPPRSTFEKYAEHLLHALNVVGPDHIGIGADWDGGGGVEGMEDIVNLPRITALLLDEGYSETEIEKIWSGNMLRLLRSAEAAATVDVTSLPTVR